MTLYVAARVLISFVSISMRRNVKQRVLLESSNPHQTWDLTSDNADCRTSHETTDCWGRDELDQPTKMKKANA